MSALVLLLLTGAAVPAVSAGPDLVSSAEAIEAPLSEVTVFSDRARMRRTARVKVPAGVKVFQLPDLPGAVMMNTVRISAEGAQVVRVETTPIERERVSIDQVEELIQKLETLGDRMGRIDGELGVLSTELGYLQRISPKMPVAEAERVGKPSPTVDVAGWSATLGFLDARRDAVRKAIRDLSTRRTDLAEDYTRLQREVGRFNLGAFTDRRVQVVAILEAKSAGTARLELEYFVAGASWWPAYDLHFSAAKNEVTLTTAGLVRQATGEPWDSVALRLSTAIPGQNIELPELLTWTLGEKREFVPRPRPERAMATATRFPPPVPQQVASESDRAARLETLRARVSRLNALASMDVSHAGGLGDFATSNVGIGTVGAKGMGSGGGGAAYRSAPTRAPAASMAPRPPPPPSAPAMEPSMDFSGADYEGAVMEEEAMMDAPAAKTISSFGKRRAKKAEARAESVARTSLSLFDPTTWTRPTFPDSTLPAVVAGGLDYVYLSPTSASIPSDGQRLRVPLAADTWKAEVRYEATPALATTAYAIARVENKGKTPILAGPMNIFVEGDFTGEGRLQTTGPGGELTLPLGADENIRIVHHVSPKTRTEGLISKDDLTDYTARIEVGNFKKRAVTVDVFDVLPMTNNEDMKVKLGEVKPALAEKPDAKGRLKWTVTVPPGKTQVIEFTYTIERPTNWQLHQR